MKVAIAGDHYAVDLVNKISGLLKLRRSELVNFGTDSKDKKITLQEIIPAVAKKVQSGEADFGILICGTGVGVEIGANRFKEVRASLCRDAEQAKNARIYDNCNVLCLGSWYKDDFDSILEAWLNNQFDNDNDRAQMIKDFDEFQ